MSKYIDAGFEHLPIHEDQLTGSDISYALPKPGGMPIYLAAPPKDAKPGIVYIRLRSLNLPPGYEEMVFRRHRGFMTNFLHIKRKLAGQFSDRPTSTILPPLEATIPEPFELSDIPEGKRVILTCGELSPRRNLIETVTTFVTNMPQDTILLVKCHAPTNNRQDPEDLRQRIRGLRSEGLNLDNVRVLSTVLNDDDYLRLIASVDGYLCGSHVGDLDITAMIAGLYGKPVFVPSGLAYETVFPDGTAMYYSGNGPEAILDRAEPHFAGAHWLRINTPGMARLLYDANNHWEEAKAVGAKAREHLTRLLDPARVVKDFTRFVAMLG